MEVMLYCGPKKSAIPRNGVRGVDAYPPCRVADGQSSEKFLRYQLPNDDTPPPYGCMLATHRDFPYVSVFESS
eukprot:COSAG01_NODE_494_length_16322_cov_35.380879_7_plen_73_part_00